MTEINEEWEPVRKSVTHRVKIAGDCATVRRTEQWSGRGDVVRTYLVSRVAVVTRWTDGQGWADVQVTLVCREVTEGHWFARRPMTLSPEDVADLDEIPAWLGGIITRATPEWVRAKAAELPEGVS